MLETFDIDALPLHQALLVFLADPLILACIAIDLLMVISLIKNPPDWKSRTARLNFRSWSVSEAEAIILASVMFILAVKALIPAFYDVGAIDQKNLETFLLLGQTFIFQMPVIILIIVLLTRKGRIKTGILGYAPADILSSFKKGFIFCLGAMPVVGMTSLIQNHFLIKAGFTNEPQYVIELFNTPGPLWLKSYLVFTTIIMAPITEEFIFRGIGTSAFADKIGIKGTVFLLSIAFGAIHLNLYSFGPLCIIAMSFSIAYIYSGSLLVPVFMHSIFNTLNLVAIFISNQIT
ncbi:MAG: hypothetical protein A2283_23145 [Lentisphaerae bacterium RIFOXYA12_FULL_48_11]|nr:MAG: hypothetical protein A2283_23145 [Lentisphaerae bacterium RIFOXYA12_FULL_48_11]